MGRGRREAPRRSGTPVPGARAAARPPTVRGGRLTAPELPPFEDHTFVFVGGLHRSGTTLFARWLASHPLVSGFSGTGVWSDEGQHLQSVYPPARAHGGVGRFGSSAEAHLTEESPLAEPESRARLLAEWGEHWDLTRPVLLEKSPPNMIRTRFLQTLFPGAHFLLVMRNPVVVALATRRVRRFRSLGSLVRHWLAAHRRLLADLPRLESAAIVRYEQLIADPGGTMDAAFARLGLDPIESDWGVQSDIDAAYARRWSTLRRSILKGTYVESLARRYERQAREFGYSVRDPWELRPPSALVSRHLLR